jgi:hypothetical protein
MSRVTVSVAGESVDLDYSLAPPEFELPSITEVTAQAIVGEHLGTTLKRISQEARVFLPAGEYPIIGNSDINNYSVYGPRALGLRGERGDGKTVVRVKRDSFQYKVARPKQAGSGLMRLGPNGGASGKQRTLSDITFIGAPQAGADGLPMFAGGLQNYFGREERWLRVRTRGLSYGGGNSPNTGETFDNNHYRDVDTWIIDSDFAGWDENGKLVGASPLGFNGSTRVRLIRVKVHHSLYSGLTFSIAGDTSRPTTDVYTEDLIVDNCANHKINSSGDLDPNGTIPSGGRFSGANHEWVRGQIEHVRPTFIMDNAYLWDTNHISHGCDTLPDNDVPMKVKAPRWNESPRWARGLFTMKLWGNQKTLPEVTNADGRIMRPMIAAGQNPATLSERDASGALLLPETHYAISADTGYVAP